MTARTRLAARAIAYLQDHETLETRFLAGRLPGGAACGDKVAFAWSFDVTTYPTAEFTVRFADDQELDWEVGPGSSPDQAVQPRLVAALIPDPRSRRSRRLGDDLLDIVHRLNHALIDPAGQQAEGGELFQGDLLGKHETILMGGRIADARKAASSELHATLLAAAPGVRRPIAGETQAWPSGSGISKAERLADKSGLRGVEAAELLLQAGVQRAGSSVNGLLPAPCEPKWCSGIPYPRVELACN